MTRALYRGFIRLHPAGFRSLFGDEMLCIFDEAARAEGAGVLLMDAVISLVRQWVLRSGAWKILVAAAGGYVVVIGALGLPVARRGVVHHGPPATVAQMMDFLELTVLTVFGLLALIVASVVWSSNVCRQRR